MTLYDLIINKIKAIQRPGEDGPVTNISATSMLTAEITLISSVLVAVIMLRNVSKILMIVAVIVVLFTALTGHASHAQNKKRTQ